MARNEIRFHVNTKGLDELRAALDELSIHDRLAALARLPGGVTVQWHADNGGGYSAEWRDPNTDGCGAYTDGLPEALQVLLETICRDRE